MAKKPYGGDDKNIRAVRFEAIRRLIADEKIGTQQELLARLNELGYHVTQGTVSRDIRDLRLVKVSLPDGGYRYQAGDGDALHASDKFFSLYRSAVIRVDSALNQVVIRCYSGMANALCASMDGMEWRGVLGTIAGDDTILVITESAETASQLAKELRDMQ